MTTTNRLHRLIALSAAITIVAILLSGPVGMTVVAAVGPQPEWRSIEAFTENYHPIQKLPYIFGFLLIVGFVLFITAASNLAKTPVEKTYSASALIFASAYVALIGLNYTIQIAYVPVLMTADPQLAALLTMSNPMSFGWALEMFGYGFLGASTWCLAGLFQGRGRKKSIRLLLIANGVVSILGAAITAVDISWVMSVPGLISFVAWNLLVVVLMVVVFLEFREKVRILEV
jgi:MFS family permease